MSTNIESCEIIAGTLFIVSTDAHRFFADHEDMLPEHSFIREVCRSSKADVVELLEVDGPWWTSEFSGRTLDLYVAALELCKGTADVLLTWEGGCGRFGYRVKNGTVTRMKVGVALTEAWDET